MSSCKKPVCSSKPCTDTLTFYQKFKRFTSPFIKNGELEMSANSMMELVMAAKTSDVQALINSLVGPGKYIISDASGPPFSLPAGQCALLVALFKDVAEEYKPSGTKYAYNQIMEISAFVFRLEDSKIVVINLGAYGADSTQTNAFYGASAMVDATEANLSDTFNKTTGTRTFTSSFESPGFSVSSPSQPNIDFSITFTNGGITTDPVSNDPVSDVLNPSLPIEAASLASGTDIRFYAGQQHLPTFLAVGTNLTTMSINGVSIVSGGSHVLGDTVVSTTITVGGIDIDLYRVSAGFTQYRNGYQRILKLQ